MPHNITDVSAFTSPVVVPDGSDDHHTLAAFIEAIAQALANRTRFLKAVTDHAAVTDADNHFSAGQHVTGAVTATGTVQGAAVTATGTVQGAAVTATGTATGVHVVASADVTSPSYLVGLTSVTSLMRMSTAQGPCYLDATGVVLFATGLVSSMGSVYNVRWPLQPIAGQVGTITLLAKGVAGGGNTQTFNLCRRNALGVVTVLATQTINTAGAQAVTLIPSTPENVMGNSEYYVEWAANAVVLGADPTISVTSISRTWIDSQIKNGGA